MIYSTPRPPPPPQPKPVEALAPHGPVIVPPAPEGFSQQQATTEPPRAPQPVTYMDALQNIEHQMKVVQEASKVPAAPEAEKVKKKQFFYNGQAWVYAFEQPAMMAKPEPTEG